MEVALRHFKVPKRSGGTRTLTQLTEPLASAFSQAVHRVAGCVEASLSSSARADRTSIAARGHRLLDPWRPALSRFELDLRRMQGCLPGSLVATDIRRCFESIAPQVVEARLRRIGCLPSDVGRVRGLLERLAELGVEGLPVGPPASAVLANAVLGELDEALDRRGVHHLRWVDDFVIFAGPVAGSSAFEELGEAMAHLGLSPAMEKTQLLETGSPGAGVGVSPGLSWGVSSARR